VEYTSLVGLYSLFHPLVKASVESISFENAQGGLINNTYIDGSSNIDCLIHQQYEICFTLRYVETQSNAL